MSNGAECCAMEVCCNAAKAQAALARKFVENGCSQEVANACAAYIKAEFALAPKSFEQTIHDIVRMAKYANDAAAT